MKNSLCCFFFFPCVRVACQLNSFQACQLISLEMSYDANSLILEAVDQIYFQNNSRYLVNIHHEPATSLTLYTFISFNF